MIRRASLVAAFAAAASLAVIGIELLLLSRRDFLPGDPGFVIDARLTPPGASGEPLRIAVLGDSTVAGVGAASEAESLPVLIGERVAVALGRPVQVVGFGVSGARTASLADAQLPRVEAGFDAIVIVIGANDATHATYWPALREQTATMLERARRTGGAVILAGTPRFNGTQAIPEPLRTFVDRYSSLLRVQQREAAETVGGVRFVDLAAEASPRFAGVPEATSSDGFHPSSIGYGFWADAIAPAVTEELGPGP